MAIDIEPKNPDAGVYGMPNAFWLAFCVETPVSEILGCHYKHEDRSIIVYEHDGYVGEWISAEDALKMHQLILEFVKTEAYQNHRYFAERKNQMKYMLDFLPVCGGFRVIH